MIRLIISIGNNKDLNIRALKDEDYKKSLSFYEKTRLIAHDPTEAQYKAIEEKYGIEWKNKKAGRRT